MGLCGYTPLVNNVLSADSARLMHFLKKNCSTSMKNAFI